MSQYDVVVIGGGAAGLSAALVLSRARRTVLVVDAGAPRNAPATHMHGYLSRDGVPPAELLAAGRHEVRSYGGPYCHGHEVRDRQLGVLGGTPGAVRYTHVVRQWTHDLVYFTLPDILTATERTQLLARAIGVVEGTIEQLVIDDADQLRGVQMRDGRVVPRDALFVPPRFVPNSVLVIGLGCDADADGWVAVDGTGRTTVPGVWAAGNIVDPRAQVVTAAGAGSAAAIALNADLVEDDVRIAVRDLDHGFLPPLAAHAHPKESP
jgi:thioredoxin reductase